MHVPRRPRGVREAEALRRAQTIAGLQLNQLAHALKLEIPTDLRRARTLIPMPLDKMVHVGQHEPIVPAVQRALEMRRRHPQMAAENIDFLEQFLDYGDYTRRKPALMDLFLDQLGTANSGWPAANPHRRLSLVSR